MKKITWLALIGLLVFFVVGFSGCGKGGGAKKEGKAKQVRIGTLHLVNGDLIALHEKWYEKELGVPVKITKFDSGKDINIAIASGSIDIGQEGTSPAALAIANKLDVEVFWIGDIIGTAETLVAKKSSGIKNVKDLIGKKVATPFASTAHYSLLNALKLAGVNENSVTILDLQPDDIYATWQRGDIDAAYVWYPVLGNLLKDGIAITDSAKLAEQGVVTGDTNVVRRPFAEANPEIVTKFTELQIRANHTIQHERPQAVKAIAAVLEISEKDVAEQLESFQYLTVEEEIDYLDNKLAKTLKGTADFLVEQKSIKSAPSLETFQSRVTAKFVKNAKK